MGYLNKLWLNFRLQTKLILASTFFISIGISGLAFWSANLIQQETLFNKILGDKKTKREQEEAERKAKEAKAAKEDQRHGRKTSVWNRGHGASNETGVRTACQEDGVGRKEKGASPKGPRDKAKTRSKADTAKPIQQPNRRTGD